MHRDAGEVFSYLWQCARGDVHRESDSLFPNHYKLSSDASRYTKRLIHSRAILQNLERCKAIYKEALDVRPNDPDALLNYYHAKQQVCPVLFLFFWSSEIALAGLKLYQQA